MLLGCQKAQPVEAKWQDGKLPLLIATDKGLAIQAEAAGEHSVQLELELSLQPRGTKGTEIGFELGLPGAPITTLSFEAPGNLKQVTLSRREVGGALSDPPIEKRFAVKQLLPETGGEALGPITSLAVSWEDASQPNVGSVALSAEAETLVIVGEADVQIETRLRMRGNAKEWRFLRPSARR